MTLEIRGALPEEEWVFAAPRAQGESVGEFTVRALEGLRSADRIRRFEASTRGVVSIGELGNRVVAVSSHRLHAYGWCYHLNGQEPGRMADEELLFSDLDRIEWFYAYAVYDSGSWREMCVPARQARP